MHRKPIARRNSRGVNGSPRRASSKRSSLFSIERLETRALLAGDSWQNPANHLDVNNDAQVSALDALVIVNDLNRNGTRTVTASSGSPSLAALSLPEGTNSTSTTSNQVAGAYLDVNGDSLVSSRDVLMVINQLNGHEQVRIRLVTTDLSGTPITTVEPGTEFQLRALVQDLREGSGDRGVFAAYLDVAWDPAIATVPAGATFTYGTDYQNGKAGSAATPGLIDEAGAIDGFTPLGTNELLLWRINVQADAVGSVTFTPDPADVPGHEVLVFGVDTEIPPADVDYVGTTLQVVSAATPDISITDVSLNEGDSGTSNMTFTVNLSVAAAQQVTVAYATADGTATDGSDYTAQSGTLTFAAGVTSQTITVPIIGDTVNEGNETFVVNLSGAVNGNLIDNQATGTILDDDVIPSLSISDVTATEGDAGTNAFVFTVTLSAQSTSDVTVAFATADATAIAGTDYVAQSGTLTFAAGTTTQSVTIQVNGDIDQEPNETFQVNLSGATGATILDAQGIGTILNDDNVPTISIDDVTIAEGNAGTTNAVFTVTLSSASLDTVSVVFNTADSSATAGADYTSQTGTLTFAPGTTTQTISVPIVGDLVDEDDETFFVNLSTAVNATIADNQGVGTITDDDAAPTITVGDVSLNEGNSGTTNFTFTVNLSAASSRQVTVAFATADGTATAGTDYVAQSGTLTFAAGETSRTVTVAVNGDTAPEADETFSLNLTAPTNATIADATGVATIVNDDGLPTLSIADASVTEGDPPTSPTVMTFNVVLSAPAAQAVTVVFTTSDGTAIAGTDYSSQTGTLTFAAGETTKTINIDVIGDTLSEANENFLVTLSNPTGATIADGTATGTIQDDDPQPTISIADVSVAEGNTGTTNAQFTLTLSAVSGSPVTVVFGTANGTATAGTDYTAQTGTVTFAAGTTTQTITVPILGDTTNEADETFLVNLSNPTNATIGDGTATGTITNDDAVPTISIADVTMVEGSTGTTNFQFTVSLSAASGQQVTVQFATSDGTATAGTDYTAQTGTVTFAPGTTTQTVSVPVTGDTTIEPNETFTVTLSNPTNATIADGTATGTITDDDANTASIGGFVYLDVDNDGIKDSQEQPVSGATVRLTGTVNGQAVNLTATTGADGSYRFNNLAPGTYTVTETQPATFLDGQETVGSLGGTSTTNDTFTVTVTGSQSGDNYNFGERGLRPEFISKRAFLSSTNTTSGQTLSVDATSGAVLYAFDEGWDGTLTAEASGAAGEGKPTLTLYDNNLRPLASATAGSDNFVRLDYEGTAGSPAFLGVSGNNSDIDLKLTNLVSQSGSVITVRGTDGDDSFEFAGDGSTFTINGTSYRFDAAKVTSVVFNGGEGNDSAVLNGSAGIDTALVSLGEASLVGNSYSVNVSDVSSIAIHGGGGADTAVVNDSAFDDYLEAEGNWLSLSNDQDLVASLHGFAKIQANSSRGGTDTADIDSIDFVLKQEGSWLN